MQNKYWGRGIRRGTNRGRGQGKGHGQGTGQTNKTQDRTPAYGNQDGNNGNQVQDNGGQYFGPMVPIEVEDGFLKTEVPTVVMYHKSFQHCEAEEYCYCWNAKHMETPPPPPNNMLFRMRCFRMGWDPKKQKYYRQKFLSNAYFCLHNMDCLQKIVSGVKHKHLYIGNYCFQSLMQEHVDLLKQYSYWDNILNNRKQLIDETASKHKGNGKKE